MEFIFAKMRQNALQNVYTASHKDHFKEEKPTLPT